MPRLLLLAGLGLLLAAAPVLAAGNFDGTYRGSQRTIRSNNSASCARLDRDNVTIHVKANRFSRGWGVSNNGGDRIELEIAPDGSFKGETVNRSSTKSRRAAHVFEMHGRIVGDVLEAEIGSNLCAVKMTLRKG